MDPRTDSRQVQAGASKAKTVWITFSSYIMLLLNTADSVYVLFLQDKTGRDLLPVEIFMKYDITSRVTIKGWN